MSETLMAISFLLSLALTVGLWWAVARSQQRTRLFWALLAAAWTSNLLGDLAWAIHEFTVGGYPDWVDLFYMARYLLVLAAFSLFPRVWPPRRWLAWLVAMLAAGAVIWPALVRPVLPQTSYTTGEVLGRTIYPILDAGLFYAALSRWWELRGRPIQSSLFWLALAMLSYGAANWINFRVPLVDWETGAILANLFWFGCTALAGVAVYKFLRQPSPRPAQPSPPQTATR